MSEHHCSSLRTALVNPLRGEDGRAPVVVPVVGCTCQLLPQTRSQLVERYVQVFGWHGNPG